MGYHWSLQLHGIYGSARQGNTGGGVEAAYCINLKENTCLELGVGMNVTAAAPNFHTSQKTYALGADISWTPMARVALTHFPSQYFGFGVVGNLGYSIRKGEADLIDPKNPSKVSNLNKPYSGDGTMLNGLFSLYLKPFNNFGFNLDAGFQSLAGTKLPGDKRDTGTVGQAGLKVWY